MTVGGVLRTLVVAAWVVLAAPLSGALAQDEPVAQDEPSAQDGSAAQDESVAQDEPSEPDTELPQIIVEAPTAPVLLGDLFEVVVRGPGLVELELTAGEHSLDLIRERPRPAQPDELVAAMRLARRGTFELTLAVIDTAGARLELPPVVIDVVLDLPPNQMPQVAERLGPVAVPLPAADTLPFYVFCLGGLAILGLLVVLAGRVVEVIIPPRPADLVAIDALARLRLRLPSSADEMLPFTVEVSDVLRDYVEGCFELHAPARTTEEFLAEAAGRHDAVADKRDILEAFLTQCDLVKYARHRPAPSESVGLLDTVESFVEETRHQVHVESDDPGDDGPGDVEAGSDPSDPDAADLGSNGRTPAEVVA